MNALLRYAILKGWREHFIVQLLVAPSVMLVTPLFVLAAWNLVRGRNVWPFTLSSDMPSAGAAAILQFPGLLSAFVIAATAAFLVMQTEMTGRAVGFFFLASRPMLVTLTVTLFGIAIGLLSYGITITLLSIVTASLPVKVVALTFPLVAGCLFSAALGTLLVGISSETTMMIPGLTVSGLVGIALLESRSTTYNIIAIGIAIVAMLVSPLVWRRRCAA